MAHRLRQHGLEVLRRVVWTGLVLTSRCTCLWAAAGCEFMNVVAIERRQTQRPPISRPSRAQSHLFCPSKEMTSVQHRSERAEYSFPVHPTPPQFPIAIGRITRPSSRLCRMPAMPRGMAGVPGRALVQRWAGGAVFARPFRAGWRVSGIPRLSRQDRGRGRPLGDAVKDGPLAPCRRR
jgi:hypothetical protein